MKKLIVRFLTFFIMGMVVSGCTVFFDHASEVSQSKSETALNKGITSGNVEGGYWIRGDKIINKEKKVYSEYKHYKKEGHASVVNGTGNHKSGGWKKAGVYSKAYLKWTSKGTNETYYDYR